MGAAASVPTQLDAAGVLALLGCEACEAADLCAGDEDDSEENGMCSREAAYAACCGAVGGCGARTAVRSSLDAVLGAALVRAGCVASTASALSAAGDELGAAQRALLAYSPCRGACDLVVGDRCYALLGTFFWPAIVTAVKRGDDDAMDGLPARVLLDLETVHARAFFGACGSSRVSEEEVAAAAATTTLPTLPTWMTVVSDLDASEFVRPADESRDAWVAHTSTKTRIDSLYFDEADRAVALLASGAVETMPEASECVKSWFRDRYNLGSNAMGADFWTFLLAREASLFRLGVLAERLLEVLERERLTETLGAVTRDLERALLLSTGGGDGESVRNDVVAPAGLADWLRARVHSDPRLSGLTPLSDETLDGVGTHCLIMLGEALDPFFGRLVTRLCPDMEVATAPVKRRERMSQKNCTDYAGERAPRSACSLDVVRCGVTAETVQDVARSVRQIVDATPVLQLARVKNGFEPGPEADAQRRERFGFCAILLNLR